MTFQVPGNHLNRQGILKNIMFGTKIIKIGPQVPDLDLQNSAIVTFRGLNQGLYDPILMILVPSITFLSMPYRFERFPDTWKVNHWSKMGQKQKSLLLRL